MIRFLHLADLHLGSAFAGFSRAEAARWREAQFAALEQIIGGAIERGAALLLFAGDVFDTPFPPSDHAERFFHILEKSGLPAVIAPGNHDYFSPVGVWCSRNIPRNVCIFTDTALAYFDFPEQGLTVYGYAFAGETAKSPLLGTTGDKLPGRVPVLLAHGDLASPVSSYAPLPAGALAVSGFAYAALGHIHNPLPPKMFGQTFAAYSGFFAGRGFDEVGKGGGLLVTLNGHVVTAEAVPAEAPCFYETQVDCSGAESGEEIRQRVEDFLRKNTFPPMSALRLRLTGEVAVSCAPRAGTLERLGEGFSRFEYSNETLPLLGAEYLTKDPTLRGAYYRALLPKLHSQDPAERETAALALRIGLSALAGREVDL